MDTYEEVEEKLQACLTSHQMEMKDGHKPHGKTE
jgi:hypothetical protein